MNNSQIDYLLQVPVKRPEPGPSHARPRDGAPAFDNHFRRASDSSVTPPSPSAAPRSAQGTTEDRRRPTHSEQHPKTTSGDSQPSSRPQSSSETDTQTVGATSKQQNDAELKEDARDQDEAPAEEASEVAALLAAADQAVNKAAAVPVGKEKKQASDKTAAAGEANSAGHSRHETKEIRTDELQRANAAELSDPSTADAATDEAGIPAETNAENPDTSAAAPKNVAIAEPVAAAEKLAPEVTTELSAKDANKASKHRGGPLRENTVRESAVQDKAETHAETQAAVDTHPIEVARATATQAKHASVAEPDKNDQTDKKTTLRVPTAAGEPASAVERPAVSEAPIAQTVTASQPQASVAVAAMPVNSGDPQANLKSATSDTNNGTIGPLSRLERTAAHASRGGQGTGRSENAPQVDPARFVSRVARAIQTAQERGGPLQLRLSPPELGAMRLELSLNHGALTAKVETDNQAARQLLLDNLPALRDRLAEQNVKIERFDVDVRRDPSGGQQNTGPQDRGTEHRQDRPSHRPPPALAQSAGPLVDDSIAIRRAITSTTINVVA